MNEMTRRYDIDWLRVFATYLLFVFHIAKVFDVGPFYHIKNAELSPSLDLFTMFIHLWHMPLFFVLAGWSAYASIKRRGSIGFRRERIKRLLIPFLLGSAILCPVLKYYELSAGLSSSIYGLVRLDTPFDEPFLTFLPTFYALERFTWSHLWFIIYLFTFSMIYAGFFDRLIDPSKRSANAAGGRRQRLEAYITAIAQDPSAKGLYKALVPLVIIQMTLRLIWPGAQNLVNDWANFSFYSLFFVYGFIIAHYPAWNEVIDAEWKRAGAIGLATAAGLGAAFVARDGVLFPAEPSIAAVVGLLPLLAGSAIAGYCLLIGILGFARAFLRKGSEALKYLSESSLPIYILHQASIVVPGYYIIQTQWGLAAKSSVMLVVAVTSSLAVYHFLVRRFAPLRLMFGMKPSKAYPYAATEAAAATRSAGAEPSTKKKSCSGSGMRFVR